MKNKIQKCYVFAFAIFFLFMLRPCNAVDLGLGYSNNAVTARIQWTNYLGSEISIGYNYKLLSWGENQNSLFIFLTPIFMKVYHNEYGNINIGIQYVQHVVYYKAPPAYNAADQIISTTVFNGNDYKIRIIFPEFEIITPFHNLFLIAKNGVDFSWDYGSEKDVQNASVGFFGINDLMNLGFNFVF